MRSTAIAGALLLLALAGCTQGPQATQPSPPSNEAEPGPLGLVNLWRVSDAEGEAEQTWLRLDAGEFQLWRDCGMIQGSWSAAGTLFIASVYGASGGCATDGSIPAVPWLEQVARYHETMSGWALLDHGGATVATLSIDGAPEPIDSAAEFFTQPPEITDEVRAMFEAPAPLPAGMEPIDGAGLIGRWVPADVGLGTDAHVEFHPDLTWTGSDGCNGGSGAWALDEAGGMLATAGPSTLIGCDGAMVPSWVAMARSAGTNGDRLVLFDAEGTELGTLVRG